MDLSQNWLLMAMLTPTFWAIGCLLDSCLIDRKVYRKPSDGAIISCLFCIVPALAVMGTESTNVQRVILESGVPITAIAAGVAYATHLVFYFRTLFQINDVTNAETFITLSVMIVPFFAWLLLGEVLPPHFYLAIAIATAGVIVQCLPVIKEAGARIIINMMLCVVSVSLSMVLQYQALDTHGYAVSAVVFNLSCFFSALLLLIANPHSRQRIFTLCRKIPIVIGVNETLGVLAILSSHRASQHGPSVSLVALIECLLPVMIILISYLLIVLDKITPVLSNDYHATLSMQMRRLPAKLVAITLLFISLSSLSI